MHVAVLGAGTMGRDIAYVCAVAGHEVTLRDVDPEALATAEGHVAATIEDGVERGVLSRAAADAARERVTTATDGEAISDAGLVVEAVPEDLELKRSVLADAEAHAADDAVMATNTSSLSVTSVADGLATPERAIGLHFFNPAYAMALVEVVVGERTAPAVRDRAVAFVEGLDKTPVEVRDTPGFASSRLGVAIGVEAMRMVEEGVASAADVDAAMELGYRHPTGPLELSDVVGLDVRLDILEYLREELGERFRPPQILKRKVRAGHLGEKTGRGFYVWEDGEAVRPADGE